jgi:hypothetical protein
VRGPDYAAHPPLERVLTLPPQWPRPAADADEARAAWSDLVGRTRVALVRDVQRARHLLLRAAGVEAGERVAVPANATRGLVEAIKRAGARPSFLDLGAELVSRPHPARPAGARVAWSERLGGLAAPSHPSDPSVWVDHADTLPMPVPPGSQGPGELTLWGLHLSPDPSQAGALVAFGDPGPTSSDGGALRTAFEALLGADDLPDWASALAQCRRLAGDGARPGLADRQRQALDETRHGLEAAAGLPLLPPGSSAALARHVAVRIPDESDASTFYAYVRGENTPVRWLPEVRPLHPAALYEAGGDPLGTAANLARWLLVPVGPDYTAEEIVHAVLGVVKASEYLGVRWRTDPARAASYANLLTERYGPDHDAYRPVFPVGR